jgi:phenylacetate-CoA ligase
MRIFDRRYELMSRAELEQLQLERLQALLVRLKRNVRRSRDKIGQLHVESMEGLAGLPFTTPEEVAYSFPYGMLAFPLREIIRLHSTVGPEGMPLVIGHTRNDLVRWGRLVARQLVACGVTANDIIQICLGGFGYPAASGYGLGAELIEASVIAEDPSQIDYQLAMLQNYRPTVLITTPTNAQELARTLEHRRIDPQSLHLRTVLLSRPVEPETRAQLAAGLFAAVQCNFGLSEILDPGLCVQCDAGHFHINEDEFLVEICDGELVVTTLAREAMPLLRYRTRIACSLGREKCACGRTFASVQPAQWLDRRVIVNERPIYHSQVATVLSATRASGHRFQLAPADRRIVVSIQVSEILLSDTTQFVNNLQRTIESEILARLGVEADVRFVSPWP